MSKYDTKITGEAHDLVLTLAQVPVNPNIYVDWVSLENPSTFPVKASLMLMGWIHVHSNLVGRWRELKEKCEYPITNFKWRLATPSLEALEVEMLLNQEQFKILQEGANAKP